jgi:hypothetical protein
MTRWSKQPPKASKSKLKLKKKGQDEDPFASDNEDNEKDGGSCIKRKTAHLPNVQESQMMVRLANVLKRRKR